MPGQSPAGPQLPSPTVGPGPADITHLAGRRGGHLRAVEEAAMTGASPSPAEDGPDDRLAIAIQSLYKARRMSLADPETAAAYDVAVQAVALLIVDGTYKAGKLGEGEHRRLRALLDAAALVPSYLTGIHNP